MDEDVFYSGMCGGEVLEVSWAFIFRRVDKWMCGYVLWNDVVGRSRGLDVYINYLDEF